MRAWFIAAAIALVLMPAHLAAQELDPPAAALFPTGGQLGSQWSRLDAQDGTWAQWPALSRLSSARYVENHGGRAVIVLARVNEGPAAARDAWQLMNETFEYFRGSFKPDYASESRLADEPMVAGCADMRRIEGEDIVFQGLGVSMSLCAADPDALVFVYASGVVVGAAGGMSSDQVVKLVLAQAA